ncbi:response regulator transcription factor [Glutamicibacter arilaitensis]|uniref:response regulator transcription factor n=1 Tax=Glutamicibacter arilaitensis TaxID=256701 RepID=UPI003A8F7BFD
MADINALRALWLSAGAEILHETNPLIGRQILQDALLRSLRAYAGSRVPLPGIGGSGTIGVFGEYPAIDPELLKMATEQAQTDHPLIAYHNTIADPAVMTLERVGELGWQLSEEAADVIERLGMRTNQISLPIFVPGNGAATYALVSEDPYTERDINTAMQLLPMISGLDAHLALLELLRPAGTLNGSAQTLTAREQVVLKLLAEGSTANSIAAKLRISPRTVHKHQENLYRKLGAVDRLSAVLRAQQSGLLATPP